MLLNKIHTVFLFLCVCSFTAAWGFDLAKIWLRIAKRWLFSARGDEVLIHSIAESAACYAELSGSG